MNHSRAVIASGASALQGIVGVMAVSGLLTGSYNNMLYAILQPFTVSLGLSLTALGTLQALGNRIGGVAGSVIQPFSGYLSDLYGRKSVVLAGSLVAIASMSTFLAASLTRNAFLLVPAYLLYGFSLLGSPASQAMIAESVGMNPGRMKVAFSVVFLFANIPGAITPYIGGLLADTIGYYLVFVIAVLLEAANLFLYIHALHEKMDSDNAGRVQRQTLGKDLLSALIPPRGMIWFFSTFAADAFSFSITGAIIYGMAVKKFGFSNANIGLIVSALYLTVILGQLPATKIMLKYGSRKSLLAGEALSLALLLGWDFSTTLPAFVTLSVIFGFSNAMWVPAQQAMLMSTVPVDRRAAITGKLAAFRGLIAVPAPILGGFLFDRLGYQAPITASAIGIFCAVVMMVRFLPDEGRLTRD